MPICPLNRAGLERWLFEREFDIREAVKRVHHSNTFSVDGIKITQERYAATLQSVGVEVCANILHSNWNSVDDRRASAACAFEQFRARAWVLGELGGSLTPPFQQLRQVTFVDTSDRCVEGNLAQFDLGAFKRKISRALARLKRDNPNLWAFGIVEISATRTAEGAIVFEPHCHLLVDNASEADVRESFKAVLKNGSAALRPVQLKPVTTSADLTRVLGYFFKLVPELRTEVQGNIGRRIKGRTNHLRGTPGAGWLTWMAAHHVNEILIGTGPPAISMRQFQKRELQPIIEELLRRPLNSVI